MPDSSLPFEYQPRLATIFAEFAEAVKNNDDATIRRICSQMETRDRDLEDFLATLGGGGTAIVEENLGEWSYFNDASFDITTQRANLTSGDYYQAGGMWRNDLVTLEGLNLTFGMHARSFGFVMGFLQPTETRGYHRNYEYDDTLQQFGNGFGGVQDPGDGVIAGLDGIGVEFHSYPEGAGNPHVSMMVDPYATGYSDIWTDTQVLSSAIHDLDKTVNVTVTGGILSVSISGTEVLSHDISGYGLPSKVKLGFTQAYGGIYNPYRGASQIFEMSGNF